MAGGGATYESPDCYLCGIEFAAKQYRAHFTYKDKGLIIFRQICKDCYLQWKKETDEQTGYS